MEPATSRRPGAETKVGGSPTTTMGLKLLWLLLLVAVVLAVLVLVLVLPTEDKLSTILFRGNDCEEEDDG